MKPIPVYTAIFGGYDNLIETPRDSRFDFTMISDSVHCPAGYRTFVGRSLRMMCAETGIDSPILANRYYKYNPPESLIKGSDVHIYLDGSLKILDFDLMYALCKKLLDSDYDIMMPRGKNGNNMLLECLLAARTGKADVTQMYRQVHSYIEKGFQDNIPTVSAGFQIRRTRSKPLRKFLDKWYFEIYKWQTRDQIAYPYVLWRTGYKGVKTFGNSTRDRLFKKMPHVGEKQMEDVEG